MKIASVLASDLNAAYCTSTPLQAPLQPSKSGTCWFWTVCSGVDFAPSFAPKIRGTNKHQLIPREGVYPILHKGQTVCGHDCTE